MRVLILGGYGNFGKIIAHHLRDMVGVELIIAGRRLQEAQQFANKINAIPLLLDSNQSNLAGVLIEQNVDLVISTAGPFHDLEYKVARAAIEAGSHYIDLADGRAFVGGVHVLDTLAKEKGVLVCSGASSVPGLSSAVVNELLPRFSTLTKINMGISTSEKIPGKSTIEGMLTYCGKPLTQWINGRWQPRYGWQDLLIHTFTMPVGKRCLASCNIPDLDLFPMYYQGVETVTFAAGTGLKLTHYGTWVLSWLIRLGIIRRPQKYANFLHKSSLLLERFGHGNSGMYVKLTGLDLEQRPLCLEWELIATNNDGVNIPCLSSVALARKLVANKLNITGAQSSIGLLTLDEYLNELSGLNVKTTVREL